MPKYDVHLDDAYTDILNSLAQARATSVPNLLRDLLQQALDEHRIDCVSEEFRRLVEDVITDNEPVLRRFAR